MEGQNISLVKFLFFFFNAAVKLELMEIFCCSVHLRKGKYFQTPLGTFKARMSNSVMFYTKGG